MAKKGPPNPSPFGDAAEQYARSHLFAAGEDLRWLVDAAAPRGTEVVIDVGTGAGHAALALAAAAREVVGVDPEPAMLEQAKRLAAERGIANARFLPGAADDLPIASLSADLIVSRFAAHHFPDLGTALAEFRRVLVPGGRLLIVDVISPPDPAAAAFLHQVETLRDRSHVRDWSLDEWKKAGIGHGLALRLVRSWDLDIDFEDWVARIRTPPDAVAELRRLLATAPSALREMFSIAGNPVVSFSLKAALLQGRALR